MPNKKPMSYEKKLIALAMFVGLLIGFIFGTIYGGLTMSKIITETVGEMTGRITVEHLNIDFNETELTGAMLVQMERRGLIE